MTENGLINEVTEYQEWIKGVFNQIKNVLDSEYENVTLKNIYHILQSDYAEISELCENALGYISMLEDETND